MRTTDAITIDAYSVGRASLEHVLHMNMLGALTVNDTNYLAHALDYAALAMRGHKVAHNSLFWGGVKNGIVEAWTQEHNNNESH